MCETVFGFLSCKLYFLFFYSFNCAGLFFCVKLLLKVNNQQHAHQKIHKQQIKRLFSSVFASSCKNSVFSASWCFICPSICLLEISGDRTNAWLGVSSITQALRHHDGQIARTVYFGIYFRKEEEAKVVTWVLQNKGLCASTAHDLIALSPDTTARSAPGSFHVFEEVSPQTKCGQTAARQDVFFLSFLPDSSLNLSSPVSLWLTLFEKLILAAKNLWTKALPFWSHVCSLELKNRRRRSRRNMRLLPNVPTGRLFFMSSRVISRDRHQWWCG